MVAEQSVAPSPEWEAVVELLAQLASTHERFSTATSSATWISQYDPDRRLRLETEHGSSWVDVESVRTCWETFERLGKICRNDVLDPGRCSAFMMALFQQIGGIREEQKGNEPYLVLAGGRRRVHARTT